MKFARDKEGLRACLYCGHPRDGFVGFSTGLILDLCDECRVKLAAALSAGEPKVEPQDRPIPAGKLARILVNAAGRIRTSDGLDAIPSIIEEAAREIAHPLQEGVDW